jgi:nucleotide-binding universal stress UspA family protein
MPNTLKLKRILIGSSLAAESDHVVETALKLAKGSGAAAHLVYAYNEPAGYAGMPSELLGEEVLWMESERKLLEAQLREQAARTGLADVTGAPPLVHAGAPHRVLLDLADSFSVDLIVIGAADAGRRWPTFGSTADRVIRKATCPVLVVRPASVFPPVRVLAPVDLSPASAGALRSGLDLLAQAGAPAAAEILFVLNPIERDGSIQFTPEQVARFAGEELHRFVDTQLPASATVLERRVRTGYPREEILAEINDAPTDLVLLGTHGRSGLERLLIGSVAADVLREAPCSVLVVPPEVVARETEKVAEKVAAGADWNPVSDEVQLVGA